MSYSYDFTLGAAGAVALAAAVADVASVTCSAAGPSVRIVLTAAAATGDLSPAEIYPPGAVLVIDGDVFGACDLGGGPGGGGTGGAGGDGYLVITGTSGTAGDVTVTGTRGNWLSAFETASLTITNTAPPPTVRTAAALVEGKGEGGTAIDGDGNALRGGVILAPPTVRQLEQSVSATETLGPLTLQLSASITSTTGFKVYSLSYSVAGGLDIELEVFASDTFAAEASSTLTTSASGERVLNPFPEIPLYGVRIPLGGRFSFLPDFRLGILFSLPVIPRYAAEINTPFEDLSARVEYTTGRRSITVRARGGLTAPTITVQSRVGAPAGFTADLSDGLIELFGPNPRNDLTLSLGLFFAPTLTLSAP